jgi:hypothetical protein
MFVRYLTGFDMIRRIDYARTSKYKWDILQVNREFIEKTKEDMYQVLEDYKNPFVDND